MWVQCLGVLDVPPVSFRVYSKFSFLYIGHNLHLGVWFSHHISTLTSLFDSARVSEAYDWIQEEVCSGSSNPPNYLCGDNKSGNSNNDSAAKQPVSSNSGSSSSWKTIASEDFDSGYGKFKDGGSDVAYYKSVKGRSGVVRIQAGNGRKSSVFSNEMIFNNGSYSKFRVIFSFYANSMETDDRFCLDYSTNGGTVWKKQQCWSRASDFNNLEWYDNKTVTLKPNSSNNIQSLIVRFRCDGDNVQDDILIDSVRVQGLQV